MSEILNPIPNEYKINFIFKYAQKVFQNFLLIKLPIERSKTKWASISPCIDCSKNI